MIERNIFTPRKIILTKRQQARLLEQSIDAASVHAHYTLDDFDLEQTKGRCRANNKMGFALPRKAKALFAPPVFCTWKIEPTSAAGG